LARHSGLIGNVKYEVCYIKMQASAQIGKQRQN
jgi:hypothetical protein